jgi:hypothetical protein
MLRHLHARESALALLGACAALACSPAPPVEVGIDYVTPPLSESDEPSEPEVPPLEDDIRDDEINPNQTESLLDFDDFIDSSFERGEVSPYCHSSFEACGGLLAGTWLVEDNCNPEIRELDVLQSWGKARMDLDETACWDAVQRLRWNWSGELRFENGVAIDNRERKQQVDMQLTSRCLNATFGVPEADSVSPQVCEALQDPATTCGLANGVCLCTNRTVSMGTASGTYGVLGVSVAIGESPSTRYEYCVEGDMLLWREKDGAQRQVVLRRTVDPPPGTTDPVDVPR